MNFSSCIQSMISFLLSRINENSMRSSQWIGDPYVTIGYLSKLQLTINLNSISLLATCLSLKPQRMQQRQLQYMIHHVAAPGGVNPLVHITDLQAVEALLKNAEA